MQVIGAAPTWGARAAAIVAASAVAGSALAVEPAPNARGADPSVVAAVAASDGEAVIVLPPVIIGSAPEHVPAALEARLAEGLRRGNFNVVAGDLVRSRLAGACEGECLRDLAAEVGATHLVRVQVVVEGRDYRVEVELLAANGETAATTRDDCEICGYDELGEMVGDLGAALRRKLNATATPAPRLRVDVEPAGSVVTVDGEVVGVTPLDVEIAGGEHDVVVRREGYAAHRQRIAAVDGVTVTVHAQLALVPIADAPTEEPTRRRLAPAGWASIAVGVAAAGAGVGLVAIDERPITSDCEGENVDALGHCRWRYNTLAGGVVMAVVGVAAIGIGAALVAIDRRRGRAASSRSKVSLHGLGFRF
ncbi:MAG: PEGA domain-containing protein [Nannocystaceae bacterium]